MKNQEIKIIYKKLDELKPYEKNPRHNEDAVKYVKNSIEKFGFKVPIVITADGEIVTGHTRFKAVEELGYEKDLHIENKNCKLYICDIIYIPFRNIR